MASDDKRLTFEFRHQWQFLYSKCNWYDFSFVRAEIENDYLFGNFNVHFMLMGVGFYFNWHYADTEFSKEVARKAAKFMEDHHNGSI